MNGTQTVVMYRVEWVEVGNRGTVDGRYETRGRGRNPVTICEQGKWQNGKRKEGRTQKSSVGF